MKFAASLAVLCACGCSNDAEGASPLVASYIIDGRSITLHAGAHTEPAAPGSAAYNHGSHFTGSTALLLGDRIELRNVTVVNEVVIVSYGDPGRTQAVTFLISTFRKG